MPWLIVNINFLHDVIVFVAFFCVSRNRFVNVPFHHLAVNEQSGVGIAATVKRSMERAKTQFRLGNHHIALFDFACEQIIQFAHIQHGYSGRQFAVEHNVVAIGRSVTAVWRVGHRDVASVFAFRLEATIQHFHAVDFFEIACFNACFNRFQVKHHAPVLLVGRGFGYGAAFFRVIAGGKRVFTLVVGIAVIQVTIHHHLPCDFHGFAV